MSLLLMKLMHRARLMAPADDGADLGGDRGDDFTPTSDAEDAAKREEAAAKEAADKAAEEAKAEADAKGKSKLADDEEEEEEGEEKKGEKTEKTESEEEKDDDKKPRKDSRIPLARHKEILEKERNARAELERQVEAFKKGQAVVATNEEISKIEDKITGLEKEYNKHLADGDLDKASATMAQIRKLSNDVADQKADMKAQAAEARAYERVRYDNIVDRLEEAYPVLVEGSDEYDATVVNKVLRMKKAYQSEGYAPADALQAAAKDILGAATKKQERAVDTDVKVDKADVAKAKEEERKKEAVKRNLEVQGKQPPDLSKTGMDSDKAGGSLTAKDAVKLNHEEFSKLDEKVLARMRGDVIA
ncbi:MAG: hypothetical protein JSS14_21930 [Proteobacteria bacterium]|nr:hypothetical protein [Pseudomonadota bacterium]